MFSAFHIAAALTVIALAAAGAAAARRLSDTARIRLLSACGWILLIMEAYKQLFIFHVVNNGVYDWWYFPFQLCSVPMYLCILLPLIHRGSSRLSSVILTFLTGYSFTGAVAALVYPEDFLGPHLSLTLHGFIWHGMLLFISLTIALSGMADFTSAGFARSTALFLVLCVIAVCINVMAEPVMAAIHAQGLVSHSYAAMFYLNPYHLSPQPVVDTIQKSAGIPLGLALYVLVIIAVSGAADYLLGRASGYSLHSSL